MTFHHAKPGMIAVHRNGGRSVIDRVQEDIIAVGPLRFWADNGRMGGGDIDSVFDIIAIEDAPEPMRVEGWVNVYDDFLGWFWDTRDEADSCAEEETRLDCRRIVWIEGQGIKDITDDLTASRNSSDKTQ